MDDSPSGAVVIWEQFARKYSQWLEALSRPHEPLYALPRGIIRQLYGLKVMDQPNSKAELAFEHLCRESRTVGFADGGPIMYEFLSLTRKPKPGEQKDGIAPQSAWCDGTSRLPKSGFQDAAVRLKGYAGWLLTDPEFLRDFTSMKERWRFLTEAERPCFPLRRESFLPDSADAPGFPSKSRLFAITNFSAAFVSFCDRWGLVGMTSWDLPDPRGLEFPYPLQLGSTADPPNGVFLYVPLHFPLTGHDDILHRIQQHQRDLAAKVGIDPSAVGLRNYKAYAQIFEIVHWERVIRARSERLGHKKTLVVPMEKAIAKHLGISTNQVRKLRKTISACRRGMRQQVAALQTRS
jgi:hypothetical protein